MTTSVWEFKIKARRQELIDFYPSPFSDADLETCEASQTRWNKQTRKYRRRSGCVVAKSAIVQVNHLLRPRFFMSYLSRPAFLGVVLRVFAKVPKSMEENFVIAGGSKGIGLELVRQLEPFANRIDVYARSTGELTVSDKIIHHCCDFTKDEVQLDDLPETIHGAAYCPGSINLRSFRGLKLQDFHRDFEINLLGAVKFLQACLSGLKKGGEAQPSSVVLFSTVAVGQGMPMHASVAAAKGAVEGLSRSLAAEWAPQIRVNCLAPALTETPLAERFFATREKRETMAANYPLARTGQPADVAAMARFLLLPESSWISGQVIGVDGGLSSLRVQR